MILLLLYMDIDNILDINNTQEIPIVEDNKTAWESRFLHSNFVVILASGKNVVASLNNNKI